MSQENERINMIGCNKDRLMYSYINACRLFPTEVELERMDDAILELLHRNYTGAYEIFPDFVSHVLNTLNKCCTAIAARSHQCINIS